MTPSALTPSGSTPAWRRIRATVLAASPLCHWCGAPADCVDHLIARARGGTDDPENLVSSCTPCNLARGDGGPNAPPSRAW
ncbi:HNH endonuclease [Catenulispora rubra]|uniref:HNH endonuclease n=1 Tax=Catenulispora rubra TaxID=280293 RepID=UPI0018926BC5